MPALKRYELSEAQLQRIAPLLPGKKGDPGRSGTDNRRFARSTPSGRPPTEPCNGLCNRVVGSQALQRLVFKGDQGLKLVLPDRIELRTGTRYRVKSMGYKLQFGSFVATKWGGLWVNGCDV
jgi:hypothetical protein